MLQPANGRFSLPMNPMLRLLLPLLVAVFLSLWMLPVDARSLGKSESLMTPKLVANHSIDQTDQTDIKALAVEVVEKLAAEDFEGATEHFNEELQETLQPEKIEQGWTALTQQIGSFESQSPPRLVRREGKRGVVIRCRFERGSAHVDVWFDESDEIAGLWIRP